MKLLTIENANIIKVINKMPYEKIQGIEFKAITPDNLEDGLSFNTKEDLDAFKRFLSLGHKGYYGYYNGNCAFRTWIFYTSDRCLVGSNFIYQIKNNEAFSAWSKTHESFLRLGIYTAALKFAIQDNPDKVIKAYVDSENIPSLKGVEKAGFKTIEKFILIKFWIIYIKMKIFELGKSKVFKISFGKFIKSV